MKLFNLLYITGASAAAINDCTPSIQLATESSSDRLQFQVTCGAKFDVNGHHGVFIAPDRNDPNYTEQSLIGTFIPDTQIDQNTITIPRYVATSDTLLVVGTDEQGKTLMQSIKINEASNEIQPPTPRALADSTCTACTHADILCQSKCQNPPQTCDFYSSCAEASLPCGSSGYAIGYGLKNCQNFMDRLSHFSSAGQGWIFRVLTCLQKFLIDGPLLECGLTCDALKKDAFGSHPTCYLDSGVCDIPVTDWVQLVITIRDDLLTLDTLKQAVTTGTGCLKHYLSEIEDEIEKLKNQTHDIKKALAEVLVLEAIKKMFE